MFTFRLGGKLLANAVLLTSFLATSHAAMAVPSERPNTTHALTTVRAAQGMELIRHRMNDWMIGLAAGLPEGAPLRFATELARIVDDGDEMRVVPLITRGISDNLNDLLYLRGVDAAIVYGDSLGELKDQPEIRRKVNYIANLFPAEMHIFVRPEIHSLEDLKGKVVNFNTKGTAAAYTGPIIFDQLHIGSINKFIPHPVAMKQMSESPDIAAVVFVSSKPLDAFVRRKWPAGFHFLPLPYSSKLGEYYFPSILKDSDYPDLIAKGQEIPTIAVPVVLAAFDWPKTSDRYRRMERFVQYFFARLPLLQSQPSYHPKWKDVNLAGTVPGWERFPPVQAELDRLSSPDTLKRLRTEAAKVLPGNPEEQDRLVQEFIKWANTPEVRSQIRR